MPADDLQQLLDRASTALDDGDTPRAHKLLQQAESIDGTDRDVLLLRAMAYAAEHKGQEALDALDRALSLHSDDVVLLSTRASILVELFDDPYEALPLLEEAVLSLEEDRPNWAQDDAVAEEMKTLQTELLLQLSDCRAMLGDTGAAVDAAFQAVRLQPEAAHVQNALARALFERCDLENALNAVERSLAAAPSYPDALWMRARIFDVTGQPDRADADFRAAVAAAPHDLKMPCRTTNDDLKRLLVGGLQDLPAQLRDYLRKVPILVEDAPPVGRFGAMDPPLSAGLMAYTEGQVSADQQGATDDIWKQTPKSITLYRCNLEAASPDEQELRENAIGALVQEVARFLGLDHDPPENDEDEKDEAGH